MPLTRTTFALLLGCLLPVQPQAAQQPAEPIELEWCLDDFPNRHHYPDESEPYGPTVDFMLELAKRAGIQIRYSPNTPFARCLRFMELGQTDLMVRLNTDSERERYMHMIPIAEVKPEVLLLHKNSPDIDSLEQLNRLNIILIRGYTYNSATINELAKQQRTITIDSIDVGLQMLQRNRGDAIVTTEEYAQMRLQSLPDYENEFRLASLVFLDEAPRFIHLALSKASSKAHLLERLEEAIAAMRAADLVD